MNEILAFLLICYIAYGLGFAVGLNDKGEANLFGFVLVALAWPFFKGIQDGS